MQNILKMHMGDRKLKLPEENGNGSEQRHSVGFIGYKQGQSQKWTKRL